jgi:hypothetical protein
LKIEYRLRIEIENENGKALAVWKWGGEWVNIYVLTF